MFAIYRVVADRQRRESVGTVVFGICRPGDSRVHISRCYLGFWYHRTAAVFHGSQNRGGGELSENRKGGENRQKQEQPEQIYPETTPAITMRSGHGIPPDFRGRRRTLRLRKNLQD